MKTFMKHIFAGAAEAGENSILGSVARNGAGKSGADLRWGRRAVRLRSSGRHRGVAAFTLVDALMASGIMVIFLAACLSAIFVNQIVTRKAKEEAIAMDFLTKYVECIKALPFASVAPNQPINWLYSGGAFLIAIPPDTNWVALNTTNYLVFHNDLSWLVNRNPKLSVNLKQTTVSGSVHDKQINVKFDWDPPLRKGGQLEVQVDFLRTANVPTL